MNFIIYSSRYNNIGAFALLKAKKNLYRRQKIHRKRTFKSKVK